MACLYRSAPQNNMQRIRIRGCAVFASDRRWDAEVFPTPGDAERFVAETYAEDLVDTPRRPQPVTPPRVVAHRPKARASCLGDYWPGKRTAVSSS